MGRITFVMVCLVCLAVIPALGQQKQDQTPRADKREAIQKQRIKQGVKSGELTKPEARRLAREQRKIKKDEAAAKSDGTVTPAERAKLQREQNRASRKIARKKNNLRTNK